MVIRCKACQEAVWIEAERLGAGSVTCDRCGQEYRIDSARKLKNAERRLSDEARRVAQREKIDLPGAYSVTLGLMTAAEVRELGHGGSIACRTTPTEEAAAPEAPAKADPHAQRFDPAFRQAVEAGLLTSRQARERGKRETYAAMVAGRYRLAAETALAVADNRMSLLEAIRARDRSDSNAVPVSLPPSRAARLATLAALALAGAVVAFFALRPDAGHVATVAAVAAPSNGSVELRTDDRGRVVAIAALSPGEVLEAYCRASGGALAPLDTVVQAVPGQRVRLGLMHEPSEPDGVRSITIREDREAGRWVAGDGRTPLVADAAPAEAVQAYLATRRAAPGSDTEAARLDAVAP